MSEQPSMKVLLESILADASAYQWHTEIRNTLALQPPALPAPPQPTQEWRRYVRHLVGCTAWGGMHPQQWRDGDEFACDCGLSQIMRAASTQPVSQEP